MKFKRDHYIAVIIFAGLIAVTALGITIYQAVAPMPDPEAQTPEEITAFIASKEFGRFDEKQRQEYLSRIPRGELNPRQQFEQMSGEQRQNLRENIGPLFRQQMQQRMEEYLQASPEERTQRLDQFIDRMEGWRNGNGEGGPGGPGGHGGRGGPGGHGFRMDPERMRNHIAGTDPVRRAQMAQFFDDLQKRMKERGITPP